MKITPEMLKTIALGMGCEVEVIIAWHWVMVKSEPTIQKDRIISYDPLTNAEQCAEIREKLKINTEYNDAHKRWESWITPAALYWHSDKWNEAVCLAAYEHFK